MSLQPTAPPICSPLPSSRDFTMDPKDAIAVVITSLVLLSLACFVVIFKFPKKAPPWNPYLNYKGPPLPPRRLLITEDVGPGEFPTLSHKVRSWEVYSHTKQKPDIFGSTCRIARITAENLESPNPRIWRQAVICRDLALQEIQAIALIAERKLCIKICYLISHPDNLRYSGNQSITRVEGAATAVIRHVARAALEKRKMLYLESNRFAKEFYKRLGFEERNDLIPEEKYTSPMVLALDKMEAFLHRGVAYQASRA